MIYIIIAIGFTIFMAIQYAIFKANFTEYKPIEEEQKPNNILNQIKNRLNIIIFIMIIPTIIQISLLIYFINELNDITKPLKFIR